MNALPQGKRRSSKNLFFAFYAVLFLVVFLPVLLWPKTRAYLQAAAILTQLGGKPVPLLLRPLAGMPVATQSITIPSSAGVILARLYTPERRSNAPAIVMVPGIHYLGMDEPRLMAFAHAMAACGLQVLTPELPGSREYRIQPAEIQAIGNSVEWLYRKTGHRAGLMGVSFSGGLALMAAAEAPYSNHVSFVFSVGAHDDLFRVATFYVTGADPLPDGDVERVTPNDYGPLVLEYERPEDYAPPADVAAIQAALRARLRHDPAREKQLVTNFTDAQKAEYARMIDLQRQTLAIANSNQKHAAEMAAVSPHGHLAGLHVPVYVLHGRGDNLIPFAEAEWLAQDLPRGTSADILVSPLVAHVGTTRTKGGLWDQWRLLHLMAAVMERAERA